VRTCYIDRDTRAIVDLTPNESGTAFTINRVNVPRHLRRKGHARRLLAKVLEDADREGIVLALWILPSGDMTFDQLHSWYEKLGFVDGTYKGMMWRKPQVKK
jgi:GNAT superfamily N-acetyltransferase